MCAGVSIEIFRWIFCSVFWSLRKIIFQRIASLKPAKLKTMSKINMVTTLPYQTMERFAFTSKNFLRLTYFIARRFFVTWFFRVKQNCFFQPRWWIEFTVCNCWTIRDSSYPFELSTFYFIFCFSSLFVCVGFAFSLNSIFISLFSSFLTFEKFIRQFDVIVFDFLSRTFQRFLSFISSLMPLTMHAQHKSQQRTIFFRL